MTSFLHGLLNSLELLNLFALYYATPRNLNPYFQGLSPTICLVKLGGPALSFGHCRRETTPPSFELPARTLPYPSLTIWPVFSGAYLCARTVIQDAPGLGLSTEAMERNSPWAPFPSSEESATSPTKICLHISSKECSAPTSQPWYLAWCALYSL